MDKRPLIKKILLALIVLLIAVSCLFPPWLETERPYLHFHDANLRNTEFIIFVGYGFILDPPHSISVIDFNRLGVQVGLLFFLGCCVVFSKYIFPQKESRPKSALSDEIPPEKNRKWTTETLLCLFILGEVLALLFAINAVRGEQPKKKSRINIAFLDAIERGDCTNAPENDSKSENATYEELMADLDSEFGAECRNGAVEKFNELVADGKVPKGNPAMATRIMERCYKEAKATQQQPSQLRKKSRINHAFIDKLMADDNEDKEEDAVEIDGYGSGVHRNSYGQPVELRPDWGGVYGERLEIQTDAYGLGVHSDQYGRPVREYPQP